MLRAQDGIVTIADSSRVVVSGIREINADRSSDGIYVNASADVLVDGVFLRTSDDSIAVYASTWEARKTRGTSPCGTRPMGGRRARVPHGHTRRPRDRDVIEHIAMQNVDMLEQDVPKRRSLPRRARGERRRQGHRRDVRFEDIRIEDFSQGQVVNLRVFRNPAYNEGGTADRPRALSQRAHTPGRATSAVEIRGYDAGPAGDERHFENIVRNGEHGARAGGGEHRGRAEHSEHRLPAAAADEDGAGGADPAIRYAGRGCDGRRRLPRGRPPHSAAGRKRLTQSVHGTRRRACTG